MLKTIEIFFDSNNNDQTQKRNITEIVITDNDTYRKESHSNEILPKTFVISLESRNN